MSAPADRAALIDAAVEAAQARGWITEWTTVAAMVDAVLPLIAEAIEADRGRAEHRHPYPSCERSTAMAARLVRSLGGEQ